MPSEEKNIEKNGAAAPKSSGADSAILKVENGKNIKVKYTTKSSGTVLLPNRDVPLPTKFNTSDNILDPFCDPAKPQKISFHDVTSAAFLIRGGVERTPCPRSTSSDAYGMDLYLKKDFLQVTGSFKERGARYALLCLTDQQKKTGVISASLGNHAQALSYHGWKLDIPVTVVMPKEAPIMKIQKCRNYKANVVVEGKDMAEAKALAMKMAQDRGLLYINGYDHPQIMAGQGTIGLEILEQVPKPDAVIIPVGGGGLIAGIATAIKALSPDTKVIGVESEKCPSFSNAMENNGPIYTPLDNTLADGLAVPKVGYNAYVTALPLIDKMVVVKEEWIALAILRLVEEEKCVVEGAGAAGLAAILAGHLNELRGKKVVILLCGGNIDTTVFGRCLERGLAAEGRLVKFCAEVSDRPGGIYELCDMLSQLGVSIKDIMHERAWLKDIHRVEVKVICETRDWAHSMELKNKLKNHYANVEFSEEPLAIHHNAVI
ncbi:PREDICTED: L-threonine ammonia-lyase-like [Rhagoletis zephyria]|uniref:L-threonine ammonia-lyase-like n=1 Tax=Rhagoletis zephyria TaxID=28612 RepID=UPI0008116A65|nr:PREDICTED: L-threonine ammonia-lyase-like [Rhagoletis zephyria]